MSTIKISELLTKEPEATDFSVIADIDGKAYKTKNASINDRNKTLSTLGFLRTPSTFDFSTQLVPELEPTKYANYIFEIGYNYDLGGQTITLPDNLVLDFKGGKFSNGTITGNKTKIKSGLQQIFNTDVTLNGTWDVKEVSAEWFGAKTDATDAVPAIQKAMDFAYDKNIPKVTVSNKFSYKSQLTIRQGVTLDGGGYKFGARFWGSGLFTGWQYSKDGSVMSIEWGSGAGSSDDYTKAAIIMESGSAIRGISAYYPNQTMTGAIVSGITTPVEYAPFIAPEYRAGSGVTDAATEDVLVEYVNFGNAYVGFDARRDTSQVKIMNCNGYPLFRGIRLGSTVDNDIIQNIHFARLNVYRGGITNYEGILNFVNTQAKGVEIGRSSWGNFNNIFCFGYRNTIYGYYQDATSQPESSRSGGVQTGTFTGIGGDLCKYVAEFENLDQDGNVISGETHWGVNIEVLGTPAAETAGRTTPPTLGNTAVLRWKTSNAAGGNRWFNADIRCHSGDGWIAYVEGSRGGKLKVDGYQWNKLGGATYKAGVYLKDTEHTKIMPGSFFDCQGTANNVAVHIVSGNKFTSVNDIDVVDYTSTGAGVLIDDNFNSNYVISLNRGNPDGANSTGEFIIDNQQNEKAIITNNIDPNNSYILGDSDVNADGLLTIPSQGENVGNLYRYQGTSTIKGIAGDRRGREVKLTFTNTCTIFHTATSPITTVEKIYLPDGVNLTVGAFDMLHLVSDNAGWITTSYSKNRV